MESDLLVLLGTAAAIGLFHTLIGPDHYLPFVVLGRARGWGMPCVGAVAAVCGVGHVLSSVLLGVVGISAGSALGGLVEIESQRGSIASALLIGFGVAYAVWGMRRAIRNRPHTHEHHHDEGSDHVHVHAHSGGHVHIHASQSHVTFWAVFIIFVLGPCEPLIPLLMYPAATMGGLAVAMVALVFGAVTVATMTAISVLAFRGLKLVHSAWMERYSHALAGAAIALSGLAITFLGI